jgi:mannose-6-phosphate isomerase-like protein (cupin superfamily)
MEGSGASSVDGETASVEMDDAFSISLGETISVSNNGSGDLKILIIGVRQ